MSHEVTYIATRGSALALAQSNLVLARCRELFQSKKFELKIIKTTGDKLQTINLTNPNQEVTKGLFTKELEVALLAGEASFAVHSLKDLPTELPEGLHLSGVSEREDPRDVLIFRGGAEIAGSRSYRPGATFKDFATGAVIGTSSTRRQAQILALRPDLQTIPIRGNVGTRIRKLWESAQLDGIVLALAGLKRLGYKINQAGELVGADISAGTLASILPLEQMLPCVGQAALGFESRIDDPESNEIVQKLNHFATLHCVTAERAFLRGMGGGCLSPVAAYAEMTGTKLWLRALSFRDEKVRRTEERGFPDHAESLGKKAADALV